jgi:hypothetical protein
MKPGTKHLIIQRGEDYSLSFSAKDKDGVPIDFTGATVQAQIREGALPTDTLIADFVGSVIDGTTINIHMSDAVTAPIILKKGYWDVLVIDTNDNDRYYLRGRVAFEGSSTVKV